jgi:hypothetical protein
MVLYSSLNLTILRRLSFGSSLSCSFQNPTSQLAALPLLASKQLGGSLKWQNTLRLSDVSLIEAS